MCSEIIDLVLTVVRMVTSELQYEKHLASTLVEASCFSTLYSLSSHLKYRKVETGLQDLKKSMSDYCWRPEKCLKATFKFHFKMNKITSLMDYLNSVCKHRIHKDMEDLEMQF